MRVDTREGSKDYIEPLRATGIEVEPCVLEAGDFAFVGHGVGGEIQVGIEIKQWDDVIACVRNGRFAEQLRGMKKVYGIYWLLIEGRIRIEDDSSISIRRGERWYTPPGRMTYQELTSWLHTMSQAGGALLWRTESQAESVAWLRSLYWWWVSKDFEQHRAHLDFYLPPVTGNAPWEEPPLVAKVSSVLPRIGSKLALRVAEEFESVEEMMLADAGRWMNVEGIGQKTAEQLVHAIRSKRPRSR